MNMGLRVWRHVRTSVPCNFLAAIIRPDRCSPSLLYNRGDISVGKAAGAWSCHSPPSSPEVKTYWALPPLPPMSSWYSAWLFRYRDKFTCRSQWPRGLRRESSSPTRTLGSWVRIHSRHGCLCVGSGTLTGWSPVQGVLLTVYRIKKLKKRPRSEGL
jgi:hypothetical protein